MSRRSTIGFYCLILLAATLNVGHIAKGTDDYFEISKNMSIFGKLYREINAYYVDEVDPTNFMRAGIDGMLESLDPYTNFISASEIEDFRFMTTGSYGGIGANIAELEDKYIVMEAYEDDPAVEAGLKVGDEVLQIDNEIIQSKHNVDIRTLLRGQAGTQVVLLVQRPGEKDKRKISITRKEVQMENVPYYGMIDDKTGLIVLTNFYQDAGKEVRDAMTDLKAKNPNIESVILDVRGNPGGLLHEAVNIVSTWVKNGELVCETRGRMEGTQKKYPTHDSPIDTTIRIAVLVNSRSASASEIVTGAIQDLDRGIVVGTRSFGKGLVQTTRALNYNTQLKLTTAKYYIPSGRCIQALDYSHRNPDGSVGKVADSLKKPFKTQNGRTVYDGGGIEPDIEVKNEALKTVTNALINQNLIFHFATEYALKHEKIAAARSFKVSDEIYKEFKAFVLSKNFEYESPAEKELSKFKNVVEDEHNYELVSKEFTLIQNKLKELKANELEEHKDEITRILTTEIIKRYYFRKGMIESGFENDECVLAAIKILNNPTEYKKMLIAH